MVDMKEVLSNFAVGYVAAKLVGVTAVWAKMPGADLINGSISIQNVLMPNASVVAIGVGVVVAVPLVAQIMKSVKR